MARLPFFALLAATFVVMTWLLARALGGWGVPKTLILAAFLPAGFWLGICVGNAIPGFLVLVFSRRAARVVLPVHGDIERGPITLRTAVAVTVRNEDMEAVLPPLGALLADLGDGFVGWVLSDTKNAALVAAEEAAARSFDPPLNYRRRADNTGYKAGNVMEFLDHHAEGIDLVLMLDADSTMAAVSVRRMVRMMQVDPRLGLVSI